MRSLFFSVALAISLVSVPQQAVFAHSKVKSNQPEIGAVIEAEVTELVLNFSKSVRLMKLTLAPIEDVSGLDKNSKLSSEKAVALKDKFSKKFTKSISVGFDALPSGTWAYTWKAVAKDGHAMKGFGHFQVQQSAGTNE